MSGKINGAEIASEECIKHGRVSNRTIKSKVEYGTAVSDTKYGSTGLKVWMFYTDAYYIYNAVQGRNLGVKEKSKTYKANSTPAASRKRFSKKPSSSTSDSNTSS